MADSCSGVGSKRGKSRKSESSQRSAKRRRMAIRRCKSGAGVATPEDQSDQKRQKVETSPSRGSLSPDRESAGENCVSDGEQSRSETDDGKSEAKNISPSNESSIMLTELVGSNMHPKFGFSSVCGRRRDMEDAVAVHRSFCRTEDESSSELYYFGVYDGHGCSHVAMKCKDRLHELVKEELESCGGISMDWESLMERSFYRMDREVNVPDDDVNCRCENQTPACVGSTAVVSIVTPDKIIVANCGDSRAVLSRNGNAFPLSVDHKPDRPDELARIQAAGGRVIFWDGPRVLGVLAMSRAIGDYYLKPFVSCEPEVRIIDRTAEDDCLILASDGLWDVVTNEMACGVVRTCLRRRRAVTRAATSVSPESEASGEIFDTACSEASINLTKLALARQSSDNVSVVVIDLKNT